MEAIFVTAIIFGFVFLIVNTCLKYSMLRRTLRLMAENGTLNGGEGALKVDLTNLMPKSNGNWILPLALSIMGVAFGYILAFVVAFAIGVYDESTTVRSYEIRQALYIGMPLFFASIGLLISYIIQRKK